MCSLSDELMNTIELYHLSPQPDDDAHDIAIADAPVMGNNIN